MNEFYAKPCIPRTAMLSVIKTISKIAVSPAYLIIVILLVFINAGKVDAAVDPDNDGLSDESVFTIKEVDEFWLHNIEFSKDGKYIYSSAAREIKKWDTKTGELLAKSDYEEYAIDGFDVSPNGEYVVSGGSEIELRSTSDLSTIRSSSFYTDTQGVYSDMTAFTSDGKYIISADNKAIRLFTVDKLEPDRIVMEHNDEWSVDICVNTQGTMIACGSYKKNIYLINTETWKPLRIISDLQDHPTTLDFSPDGHLLAAGLHSGEIIIFQLDPLKVKFNFFGHQSWVNSIAFSPDGNLLASGGSQLIDTMLTTGPTAKVWSTETGKLIKEFAGHGTTISALSFSPDGKLLATSGGTKMSLSDFSMSESPTSEDGRRSPFPGDCIKFWNVEDLL